MILFRLEHIEDKGLYRNVELKILGYFSSLVKAKEGIQFFQDLKGFSRSPKGFIIREIALRNADHLEYLYELEQQIHDDSYDYWYEKTLGVYASFADCEKARDRFLSLNENTFSGFQLTCELYVNCIKVDECSQFWGEGFDTTVGGKEV